MVRPILSLLPPMPLRYHSSLVRSQPSRNFDRTAPNSPNQTSSESTNIDIRSAFTGTSRLLSWRKRGHPLNANSYWRSPLRQRWRESKGMDLEILLPRNIRNLFYKIRISSRNSIKICLIPCCMRLRLCRNVTMEISMISFLSTCGMMIMSIWSLLEI